MTKKGQILDITGDVCPLTFVKAKLFVEGLRLGEVGEILLRDGEARQNVPRSLRDQGHGVIATRRVDGTTYSLLVERREGPRYFRRD